MSRPSKPARRISRTGRNMSQTVVFFRGVNTSNQLGLWETNGTASGTFQLTRPSILSNLVAFNDEVLFEGQTRRRLRIVAHERNPNRHSAADTHHRGGHEL